MNIQEFIRLCAGRWFSQRTGIDLTAGANESHRSEISIDLLGDDLLSTLARGAGDRPDDASCLGGLEARWQNPTGRADSALLVFFADGEDLSTGRIVRSDCLDRPSLAGLYRFGGDEALTLTVESDRLVFRERLWFASPNLRLRTSTVRDPERVLRTFFYSEIRKMSAPSS
jgi:hypothetical protein